MRILDYVKENILYLDGGTGSLLQKAGLAPGESPERWNLSHSETVINIHKDYFDAGANVVCTNTFGANVLKFSFTELEDIISAAVGNAKSAAKDSKSSSPKWIALDIGPTGRMLKPLGDLDFEDAVSVFAETVKIGVKCGVDLIFIETMSDSYETKAALLAAKENCDLPVFVSNAYGEDGKLMTGADPRAMVALLEGMGADAIGVNCSFGPSALVPVVKEYLKYSSLPVILKPNAGMPSLVNGKTVYDITSDEFSSQVAEMAELGVGVLGGCCGTTPEHISAVVEKTKNITRKVTEEKNHTLVSSYTHSVELGARPTLIGERINPTGKPRFREALKNADMEYILREAIAEEEAGAHILDVNVGVAGLDEVKLLPSVVEKIQEICDLPLQIDTANLSAMEKALRRYNGKPMINSVNGKEESLAKLLPLAKKYGGVLVCLTLDEDGIPAAAEGRLEIAKKIYNRALEYGIKPKDLIFDPLAMAVSADKNAAVETLSAVKLIRDELGCHISLGVSNVSFGLPNREILNSTFFSAALANGLTAAIINPLSYEMMKAYYSHLALSGLDENFREYIAFADEKNAVDISEATDLKYAIIKGLKVQAADHTRELIKKMSAIEIVNEFIAPALDTVGTEYEKKKIYLPSLLMSAEAAASAFDVIKASSKETKKTKCTVVLATVKGDIHDIGKNIIKLVLENYGFEVIDLGKDVPCEKILDAVLNKNAKILGLSALMTTTLPAMEETVRLVKRNSPKCKIMVGGAVLTEEYAKEIGADFYGKDAIEAAKYADKIDKM